MGIELYKIFEIISEKMGGKGRIMLAEKTGVTMAKSMEIEDSKEMMQKFYEVVKEIEGVSNLSGTPLDTIIPEKPKEDWKEVGYKMIDESVKVIAKYFGRDFAEEMFKAEANKVSQLGVNSSINDIKFIFLPKIRKKFKEFMNPDEIEKWFQDNLNKYT